MTDRLRRYLARALSACGAHTLAARVAPPGLYKMSLMLTVVVRELDRRIREIPVAPDPD